MKKKKKKIQTSSDNVGDPSHFIAQRIMNERNLYSLWMAQAPSFQSLDSKEIIYDDGLRFLEKMQLEEAVDFYNKALKDDPTSYIKWNNLGVAYMGLKERKDALKCYEKALESKASYYIGLYNKGAVYFVCEEYQEAINYFEKSLRLNPKCAEAYWDKHMANEKMGNFDFSTGTVEGLKMGLNIMRAKLNHSSALVDLGDGRDAILGHFMFYLKDKEKLDNLFYRANDLHERQKYQEALELLNNAIQLNPEDMDMWFLRGKTIYNLTEDHKEALRCVQNGLKIDKNSLKGWLGLAIFFNEGKEYEKALESLNRVLRINPFEKLANDLKIRILLDRCLNLKKQGKFYEAVKPLDLLLEDHPKDEGVWVEKGNIYVGMKDLNKAIGCYNTAIKIDPQNYHAHFNKGVLNLKQGNNTAALECFTEALKIRPNDPKAEKYIDIAKKATPDLLGMLQKITQLIGGKYDHPESTDDK
jgi:tetratricopeptide (TPR) repeat protein